MQPKLKVQPQRFKIAAYIRVSTEEQAENPEGSIRNQEDRIREAIQYRNRTGNYGDLVQIYTDPGISAKDMRRPALQQLIRDIRSGEITLVVVTELSRLSRNTRDFIQLWDLMREVGCRFSSLREDFDTTNAAGELVLFQLMNLAQFERRQTSERVEANIAARSKRGLYNGGSVPVGFRTIKDKSGYLEIDPEMSEVVKIAFQTFLHEGSLSKACLWLNSNGYRLRADKEGGGSRKRVGHFMVSNLQKMLTNKAYVGIKAFKIKGEDHEVRAVWPSVIDEMTFKRAGKLLKENCGRLKPERQQKLPYILSGLTYCAKCNDPMCGKSAHGNGGKIGYYEHSWATKRDSTLSKKIFKCEPHRVLAKRLEPLVWDAFVKLMTDKSFVQQIFEKVKSAHAENPTRKEQERLKAKIFGLSSQLDALAERLSELPKSISAKPIYQQMERIENLKAQHVRELEVLKSANGLSAGGIVALESFEDFAIEYRKLLGQGLTADAKKRLLKRFIHKIEIGTDSVKIHVIVDKEHYRQEAKINGAGAPLTETNFLKNFGSNTLTVGTRDRT